MLLTIQEFFFFFFSFIYLFYFTILYSFCHTLTWIRHRCTWFKKTSSCESHFNSTLKVKWSRSVMSDSLRPLVDCSLPGSSVHGILQARILEWVTTSFFRNFPDPGIEPESSALQADALLPEPPGKHKTDLLNNLWLLLSTPHSPSRINITY